MRTSTVVGIFDLENTSVSRHTRKYLAKVQKEGKVVNVSLELPKSFVVCVEEGKERVYISQIASSTLLKRLGYLASLDIRRKPPEGDQGKN